MIFDIKSLGKFNLNYLSNIVVWEYESIFRLVFVVLAIIFLFLLRGMFAFRDYALEQAITIIPFQDFTIIIVAFIGIHLLKTLTHRLCFDYVYENIHTKHIGEFRTMRALKIVKWIYDGVYYSLTSIMVYCLFHHEPWYPESLGGLAYSGIWQEYPQIQYNKWLSVFYMIQTSNHLYAQVFLFIRGSKVEAKYWEYMLHHSLATCLLFFSAMYNCVRIGVVVLAVHDIADIILSVGRAYCELKHANKALLYFQVAALNVAWVYTRMYVFPQVIWEAIKNMGAFGEHWEHVKLGYTYMVVQMLTLLGLHLYWTYCIIMTGVGVVRAGKYKNTYDNREIPKATAAQQNESNN